MEAAAAPLAFNKLGRTSLSLGILSLKPRFALFILGALVGLRAIITGAIALSQISREGTMGRGRRSPESSSGQ